MTAFLLLFVSLIAQLFAMETNMAINEIIEPFHGYIEYPPSRAYLCRMNVNKNCGPVQYEPQSVEGAKGFPEFGPPDGKIASGGVERFHEMDEFGENRWHVTELPFNSINSTHVKLDIHWRLTMSHSTEYFALYLSNEAFDSNQPLKREFFNLTPGYKISYDGQMPGNSITQKAHISKSFLKPLTKKPGVMLGVWSIADTGNAFYQVIDAKFVCSFDIDQKDMFVF